MPGILVGCCGNFCLKCPIYVASTSSDYKMKEKLAAKYSRQLGRKVTPDEIHCWGCRAGNRNCWGKRCQVRKCAAEKGLDFCYQCSQFPCPELSSLSSQHPEALDNLNRISKIGVDAFISEASSQQ